MKTNNSLQYKGYSGTVTYSEEDGVFHGKVAGIKALISFEGDSVSLIKKDFHNAVDEYLEFCNESGLKPEKPFKGSFNVRINPELHRQLALYSSAHKKSLNSTVEEAVSNYIDNKLNQVRGG